MNFLQATLPIIFDDAPLQARLNMQLQHNIGPPHFGW